MNDKIRLVVDGVGGDYAPYTPVAGVIQALEELPKNTSIILVGPEEELKRELEKFNFSKLENRLILKSAEDRILSSEPPAVAAKNKPFSSIMVGLSLLKEKEGEAFISAGSTGAIVAGSILTLGRIPGISRPAIATVMPTRDSKKVLVLDVGASIDCKPENLVEFCIMGSLYAYYILEIPAPKVGLLSIGEEEIKGNRIINLAKEKIKSQKDILFFGNIEGNDILAGKVDVVVTDGFVGNILLKFAESLGEHLFHLLKEEFKSDLPLLFKLNLALFKRSWNKLRDKLDYVAYGGAPLLGIRGDCIICHGRSNPEAIKNGILTAFKLYNSSFRKILEERLCKRESVL